jgi:putative oxidoreductase
MNRFTVKYAPYAYAIMRIVVGLMFAVHGSQKLFAIPPRPEQMHSLNTLMKTAGGIEFGCGLLIAVGFLGGYAAFLASGQMAVAYFMRHFPHNFESIYQYLPSANGGELAVLYCFVFLFIAAYGSGAWSVDACLGISKTEPLQSRTSSPSS